MFCVVERRKNVAGITGNIVLIVHSVTTMIGPCREINVDIMNWPAAVHAAFVPTA